MPGTSLSKTHVISNPVTSVVVVLSWPAATYAEPIIETISSAQIRPNNANRPPFNGMRPTRTLLLASISSENPLSEQVSLQYYFKQLLVSLLGSPGPADVLK